MATVETIGSVSIEQSSNRSAWLFGLTTVGVMATACALAGWAPLGFSIVTVFLFAGPHNWLEARYFMTRMPARWGKLRPYFLVGILGVPFLAAASAALPLFARAAGMSQTSWLCGVSAWNTAFVVWVVTLIEMRRRQNPRREWPWVFPIGFVFIAAAWLWPYAWSLLLVYLHPCVAIWFLDRELGRSNVSWQRVFRRCLFLLPIMLGLIWWNLWNSPHLPGADVLSVQIANHAGGSILSGISSHLLVSTHTFLEMLHYAVWIVAVPLVANRAIPWKLTNVPLAKKSASWRRALSAVLVIGAAITIALWAGFLADYPLTRDLYFTIAVLHVLAEVPFLLRLL